MKNIIFILAIATIMGGPMFTSCQSSSQKVDNARHDVIMAKFNLHDAKLEYQTDIDNLKKVTAEKIAANDKILAEFDARIETQKVATKADYKKKVIELEQKNSDLKMKMANYKEQGKENWEKFKADFNKSLDELAKAFKGLAVLNTK